MISGGPFQPQPCCDSVTLRMGKEPHDISVAG